MSATAALLATPAAPEPVALAWGAWLPGGVRADGHESRKPSQNALLDLQYLDAPDFGKYLAADATRLAAVVKVVGKLEDQK